MKKQYWLAWPRGYCMGVARALKLLDDTLASTQDTVYVRQEIVNNQFLVEHYRTLGALVVNEVSEVPRGGTVVFSAHGVAPSVRELARERELRVIDATCPLVAKVHREAVRLREAGREIVLIGVRGHKEMIGVTGEAPGNITLIERAEEIQDLRIRDPSRVAWLSQTTLNVDDTLELVRQLREKYPEIQGPDSSDICQATKERQQAVKCFASECDLFIVAGSFSSSNTRRLAEVAADCGARRVLRIDGPEELAGLPFSEISKIGITSGVSVSPEQLRQITDYVEGLGYEFAGERTPEAAKP